MARIVIFAALVSIALALPQDLRFNDKSKGTGRIVGGVPVQITDFPYIVQVNADIYFCGGSILSTTWVLTAGHCLEGLIAENVTIRAASNLSRSGGIVIQADEIFVHPQYNQPADSFDVGPDYDIALIKLQEPLTFGSGIASIQLIGENEEVPVGTLATVSGWGLISEDAQNISDILRAVSVPVIDQEECRNDYNVTDELLTERMLCASYDEGGKDSCSGDSGGPLVVDDIQFGIVSWGRGCAREGQPGVYTKIAALREYVRSVANL